MLDKASSINSESCAASGVSSADGKSAASCHDSDGKAVGGNGDGRDGCGACDGQGRGGENGTGVCDSAAGVGAPTPNAPRHGVRLDGLAGGFGSVVYQRYCHVYVEGELEGLVERVRGLRLVESYYDRSNWCVVAERET